MSHTVLVVEDDVELREMIREHLRTGRSSAR